MSYSDFKDLDSLRTLEITTIESVQNLIAFEPIEPSSFLIEALKRFVPLTTAINTQKARSEYMIAPILSEIAFINSQVSLFSGRNFNVDASRGLTGFCDFILTHNPDKLVIKAPVVVIVEAKNENINDGLAQCIASMYAAQIVNQKNLEVQIKTVYGTFTTGQVWRFLSMDTTQQIKVDLNERYLTPINELLGILSAITSISN
ncbi:hypothetical protein DSM106972_070520 [Dulcicalothrix desertica PCC 7102]|uniref:Type I restriction enzyme R protein N-terminal domain-containing protein n=1 Tax=Dulcicalothrix desertica PCC 7102 TaxID=232991 RepID=A0A3S1CGH6_9CYAN|nr:hypothetical protein [Dulcicalothrix desertica]RUT01046.1 hypothetical protein DSM106972_070520 [Dulcicalothrix desertica PCC 7102]TWH39180.1 hypothetical protein CAL7102_08392 [Dulcicalothrix desertica PCC 7102]